MRGKTLLLLNMLCMICIVFGFTSTHKVYADTQGSYSYEYFEFMHEKGTVEITRYTGNDAELVIPAELGGSRVAAIGFGAFENCENLETVEIPSGVKSIGDGAFEGCSNLRSIKLPEGLEQISGNAFSGCSSLESIEIPSKVKWIQWEIFSGCSSLQSIRLSAAVTNVSGTAFAYCDHLQRIDVDAGNDNYQSVDGILYSKDGKALVWCPPGKAEEPDLLNGVERIEAGAFASCRDLQRIFIPSGVDIECTGLEYCENLLEIDVDAGHTEYRSEDGILYSKDGTKLLRCPAGKTEVMHFSSDVQEIEYDAFSGCSKLGSLDLPSSVTVINAEAFENCKALSSINIPLGVTDISGRAFMYCDNLKEILVDADNPYFVSIDGVLYNKDKTELLRYPGGKADEVKFLETVTEIGNYAFAGCTGLKNLVLQTGITTIGRGAFSYCGNLSEIKFPIGLEYIESGAFVSCSSITSIEIPEGVAEIKGETFTSCENLASITIPLSMKEIEMDIFSYYNRAIRDIYYAGSKEQWEKVGLYSDLAFPVYYDRVTIHYNNLPPVPDPPIETDEPVLSVTVDAKQELERLKSGDTLALTQDFLHFLNEEQIDIVESCLYTWLAEINYAYKYAGSSGIKERIMKKAGIDPEGNFASGTEQAVTHISVETKYGTKTIEVTLDLGKPDSSGNLYPAYGAMQYEILEKDNIPLEIPKSGPIGKTSYADMGVFVECVGKASDDSLHAAFQWESLSDEMASGILSDKTVTEIIGNKNGSFTEGTFIVYTKQITAYSKKITVSCPADIHIYSMDGQEVASIIDNKPNGGNQYVSLGIEGDIKTVRLSGNDYFLSLRAAGAGTMQYKVEEIVNEEVQRTVQILEGQLEQDMRYEGYVFRPLNTDRNLYALRKGDGTGQEVFYPGKDDRKETLSVFKRIEGLLLSQKNTALDADKSIQLNASLSPTDASNPNLRWTTADESIAKVDNNGLVTAVRAGTTTVTVSTKDGSFLKQYCVIDVAEKKVVNDGNYGGGWTGGYTPSTGQGETPVVAKLHYVLQFQANGGTELSRRTMTLLADDSPGILPKVKRKDYTFDGWYTQQVGGRKVTGDEPLKGAATLYAQWTKTAAPAKPAAPTVKSKKKGQIQVSFQKVSGAAGYQIEYSADPDFTSVKAKEASASAKTKTITGLKAGKKYYVRIRAYNADSMKNRVYSTYSEITSIKVKS